jgi:ABC-2 type transport system ATP-binding protein
MITYVRCSSQRSRSTHSASPDGQIRFDLGYLDQRMISCRNLTRRFGNKVAVECVNLELARGAICALLGPNGAGKSTLLAMLAGILPPTEGEACVANVRVKSGSLELRQRIGVLPEYLGLFDDLTIEEHLRLTCDLYGVARSEAVSRINQLLQLFDLERDRTTFASECSHGMRKKTAIAMALLPKPSVLLLDEPFEGIDLLTTKVVQRALRGTSKLGVTTLMATHVFASVEQVATHVLILRNGRMAWHATAAELSEPLEATYLRHIGHNEEEHLTWLGSHGS